MISSQPEKRLGAKYRDRKEMLPRTSQSSERRTRKESLTKNFIWNIVVALVY